MENNKRCKALCELIAIESVYSFSQNNCDVRNSILKIASQLVASVRHQQLNMTPSSEILHD